MPAKGVPILTKCRVKLDRLYAAIDQTLKKLSEHLAIAQPAWPNTFARYVNII